MERLHASDLFSLEDYSEKRAEFRSKVLEHKKHRRLHVGPNLTLLFEDRLTIQYQIQEMLRIERIFERAGIQSELDAYNPLIPGGRNWIATCLIEFENPEERARRLAEMGGLEDCIWCRVDGREKLDSKADEDLPRSNEGKTSAVHFLSFNLGAEDVLALKGGAGLSFGVNHDHYRHEVRVPDDVRQALLADLA